MFSLFNGYFSGCYPFDGIALLQQVLVCGNPVTINSFHLLLLTLFNISQTIIGK